MLRTPSSDMPGFVSVFVPRDLLVAARGFGFPVAGVPTGAAAAGARATLASGAPLPSWLRYEAATASFVATAPPVDALPLEVLVQIGGRSWTIAIAEEGG
jgi:hypothetical protein